MKPTYIVMDFYINFGFPILKTSTLRMGSFTSNSNTSNRPLHPEFIQITLQLSQKAHKVKFTHFHKRDGEKTPFVLKKKRDMVRTQKTDPSRKPRRQDCKIAQRPLPGGFRGHLWLFLVIVLHRALNIVLG